jgi:hypothetical protein
MMRFAVLVVDVRVGMLIDHSEPHEPSERLPLIY